MPAPANGTRREPPYHSERLLALEIRITAELAARGLEDHQAKAPDPKNRRTCVEPDCGKLFYSSEGTCRCWRCRQRRRRKE